jgi:uncharacterized membrane protein (DUF4010 family)
VVAALAGLTDVDAITLSMAGQAGHAVSEAVATRAITLAALSNTLSKCGLVVFLGAPSLRRRIVPATAVVVLGGALALLAG